LVQSTIDTRFCPSVDNDAGAFLQQPAGNAKSNPSGGTGDKGCFSFEVEIQLVTDRYNLPGASLQNNTSKSDCKIAAFPCSIILVLVNYLS
jgi:hypothetical protein